MDVAVAVSGSLLFLSAGLWMRTAIDPLEQLTRAAMFVRAALILGARMLSHAAALWWRFLPGEYHDALRKLSVPTGEIDE